MILDEYDATYLTHRCQNTLEAKLQSRPKQADLVNEGILKGTLIQPNMLWQEPYSKTSRLRAMTFAEDEVPSHA